MRKEKQKSNLVLFPPSTGRNYNQGSGSAHLLCLRPVQSIFSLHHQGERGCVQLRGCINLVCLCCLFRSHHLSHALRAKLCPDSGRTTIIKQKGRRSFHLQIVRNWPKICVNTSVRRAYRWRREIKWQQQSRRGCLALWPISHWERIAFRNQESPEIFIPATELNCMQQTTEKRCVWREGKNQMKWKSPQNTPTHAADSVWL